MKRKNDTDGKIGLQMRVLTLRFMIGGVLREVGWHLMGHAEPLQALQVKVVPAAIPVKFDE